MDARPTLTGIKRFVAADNDLRAMHRERSLFHDTVHDVASARHGYLKGVPLGERPSVACYDDIEDARWNCREIWLMRGTDRRVQ